MPTRATPGSGPGPGHATPAESHASQASPASVISTQTRKRSQASVDSPERVNRRRTKKTTRACDFCKSKKLKCSGSLPCDGCSKRRLTCVYDSEYRRGRPPTPPPAEKATDSRYVISHRWHFHLIFSLLSMLVYLLASGSSSFLDYWFCISLSRWPHRLICRADLSFLASPLTREHTARKMTHITDLWPVITASVMKATTQLLGRRLSLRAR
jgi:hypothetical protein